MGLGLTSPSSYFTSAVRIKLKELSITGKILNVYHFSVEPRSKRVKTLPFFKMLVLFCFIRTGNRCCGDTEETLMTQRRSFFGQLAEIN